MSHIFRRYACLVCFSFLLTLPAAEAGICSRAFWWLVERYENFHIRLSAFETQREIADYMRAFGDSIVDDLSALGPNDQVVEMGSGETLFAERLLQQRPVAPADITVVESVIADSQELKVPYFHDPGNMGGIPRYLYVDKPIAGLSPDGLLKLNRFLERPLEQKPTISAITFRVNREVPNFEGRLRLMTGRLLKNIGSEEIGRTKLIIDEYGVLTYDPYLDRVLTRYMELLEVGGSIYVFPAKLFLFGISSREGKWLDFPAWAQRIQGLDVERLTGTDGQNVGVRITKLAQNVSIPALEPQYAYLHPIPGMHGPAIRKFREK